MSDRPWHGETSKIRISEKTNHLFAPDAGSESFSMDSILYTRLIENGTSDYCAMTAAFGMSDVTLERTLPNRCHAQFYKFQNCTASILEDTVIVSFSTQNLRRSVANNKIINVKVHNDIHHAEIIHWGEEYRTVTTFDGSQEVRKSPRSEIMNTKLNLNKRYYEIGDTIIGEIKITSFQQKGRRKTKVREYTKGKFRAIIGGYGIDCAQEKALATSWLRN